MSIAAECPHCETRFHLQPELAGKTMRCPNPDCRQVFEVAAALPPLPTMPLDDGPSEPEVVEAQVVAPPKGKTKPPKPPKRPRPTEPEVVEAVVVPPARPGKKAPPADGPREVVWSPDADLPPPAPPPRPTRPAFEEVRDDPVRPRRKRRKDRGPVVLVGLFVLLGLTAGGGVLYWVKYKRLNQDAAVARAEDLFKDANKQKQAEEAYTKLVADYPDHPDVEKFKFFADLAAMKQRSAPSPTARTRSRPSPRSRGSSRPARTRRS